MGDFDAYLTCVADMNNKMSRSRRKKQAHKYRRYVKEVVLNALKGDTDAIDEYNNNINTSVRFRRAVSNIESQLERPLPINRTYWKKRQVRRCLQINPSVAHSNLRKVDRNRRRK